MSITINDGFSEKGAENAKTALKEAIHLMAQINMHICEAAMQCGVEDEDAQHHLSNLESEIGFRLQEIEQSLAEYNGEQIHNENPPEEI